MKKSFRILSIVILLGAVSCTKDITNINVNPKSYTNVPGPMLFTNAERNLVNGMTSANVNQGIFRLIAQQWTETTYLDETQYDLATRSISQNFWNILYRDVLRDFKEARNLITADLSYTDASQKASQLAIIDVLEVYSYSVLVTTFGDVPYTAALDFNNLNPAYDDASTIFNDLLARLDTDVATLNATTPALKVFAGTADLIYGGSAVKWAKFANSLKVRMGMTLADSDPAKATSVVTSALTAGGPILANADNAILTYLSATPNTNPVWVDLVQSGRQDFVAANTIADLMNSLADPRLAQYFTVDQNGLYSGGILGEGNSFAKYSKPSAKLTATTFPGVLLDAAETQLYLSEAALRGFIPGGAVEAEIRYNAGISSSFTFWGAGDPAAYLASPGVLIGSGTTTTMEKIATQKYLALYNRGFEAWTEIRRLDFPVMNDVVNARSGFPNRFTYPVGEQNLNTANYTAAAAKAEGDLVENQLFWDKN